MQDGRLVGLRKLLVKNNTEPCVVEMSGEAADADENLARGTAGASNPRRSLAVPVPGAVQVTADKWARSTALGLVGGGSVKRACQKFRFARTGCLADGEADLCGCDTVEMVLGAERKRRGSGRTRCP